MTIALIDNGSLEPAAHENLRAVAVALSERSGVPVLAVSWKHSDQIAPGSAGLRPASMASGRAACAPIWTLAPFIRSQFAAGERDFLFVPFFISPQGAIGSALRNDLEQLRRDLGGFDFRFTPGLADRGVIPRIVADRIRDLVALRSDVFRTPPPVIVVDHGGPSRRSALLRDRLANEIRRELGHEVGLLAAASMEGAHGPLLEDQLRAPEFEGRDVIVAPLFLAPGRHAGPQGDVARICTGAAARCHLTALVGTHPLVVEALAEALHESPSFVHAQPFVAGRALRADTARVSRDVGDKPDLLQFPNFA